MGDRHVIIVPTVATASVRRQSSGGGVVLSPSSSPPEETYVCTMRNGTHAVFQRAAYAAYDNAAVATLLGAHPSAVRYLPHGSTGQQQALGSHSLVAYTTGYGTGSESACALFAAKLGFDATHVGSSLVVLGVPGPTMDGGGGAPVNVVMRRFIENHIEELYK